MGHPIPNASSSSPSPIAPAQTRFSVVEDPLEALSLGVYRVFFVKNSFSIDFLYRGAQTMKNWMRHLSLAIRLLTELASFDRNLLVLYVILGSCLQMEATVLLSVEIYIMRTVRPVLRQPRTVAH